MKFNPIQWASDHGHYGLYNLLRKTDALITAAYFLYDFPDLRRFWGPIVRSCVWGILGLQEDLRVSLRWNGWSHGVQPGKTYVEVYYSYTGSMLYPTTFKNPAMR